MQGVFLLEWVKVAIGFVGGFISWMIGGLGFAFVALLGLMAVDFISGIAVGYASKELSSRQGTIGLWKKIYIILLIGCVYLVEKSVLHTNGMIGDGVTIAYIVIEFISIAENGGKLGIPLGPVANIIKVLKDKQDNTNNQG